MLDFAVKHIAERPAVPKDIIFIESIPLTAMGKIFKPVLRWQQVKKVFDDELKSLQHEGISASVEVAEDKQYGMLAIVKVDSIPEKQRLKASDKIGELLNQFTVNHRIDWL